MAANLVHVRAAEDGYRLTSERDPLAHTLMLYRKRNEKEVPWHRNGQARASWTWADVKSAMLLDEITIRSSDSYSLVVNDDGTEEYIRVPEEQHLRLHLGKTSQHLGTMGQNYALLSRKEFYAPIETFLSEGFELDTCGDLAGGSRSWFQIDLGETVEIRKDDPVRSSALFANSYDGSLAYTAGLVVTRVVCANTLAVARQELRDASAMTMKAKHSGNIQGKATNITTTFAEYLAAFRAQTELYKRLDSVKVRGQLDLLNFAAFYASDASDAKIKAGIDSIPKVSARSANAIENAWENGPGSRKESFWDLFNAATFDLTHSLGNEKQGESESNRIGRRLDSLLFGASSKQLATALRVAETMASLRAA